MEHRAYARPTSIGCIQHLNKSGRWIPSCGVVARSTTSPWKSARLPGRRCASRSPTTSRQRVARPESRLSQNTARSTLRSCKMCYAAWIVTFQAFFRRIQRTAKRLGYPRFQGRSRYHSFTYPAIRRRRGRWTAVFSASPRLGVSAIRLHRPLEGTPKTVTISREADGWYVCFACADVPVQPLPPTGRRRALTSGIESFATLSDGTRYLQSRLVS